MRKGPFAPLVLLVVACAGAPGPSPAPVVPPPPELATIAIPIGMSLDGLAAEIEAAIPTHVAADARELGVVIRYDVTRAPIQLAMTGASLQTRTAVRYVLDVCPGRIPCVSCGRGEAPREAAIALQTKLEWDPEWRLRSTTVPLPADYPKPCRVTWLEIDLTRRFVAPVLEAQLARAAALIDRRLPPLTSIRSRAEEIWNTLLTPMSVGPRSWAVMEPADVTLSPIRGRGADVTTTLVLRGHARLVVGERPPVVRTPLPPLRTENGTEGLRIPVDLEIAWGDVQSLLAAEVTGKTFPVSGHPLTVESIRISPVPGGKIRIDADVDYRGGGARDYRGPIRLEGTPRFDEQRAGVVLPDLDYAIVEQRRGLVKRLTDRAARAWVRERLRSRLRLPATDRLEALRHGMTEAINRPLDEGVLLRGAITRLDPVAVTAAPDALLIRVVATGNAEVSIRQR